MSDISDKYDAFGGPKGFLGAALTEKTLTPDGNGLYVHYEWGSIYWSKNTSAHGVHGAIRDKWASLGWEQSILGYPITDENPMPDGIGRYNYFEKGSIYWTPETGAFEVHGEIRDHWAKLGWERSALGYPT